MTLLQAPESRCGPCLYCQGARPTAKFVGREHVIPQAFGTFEPESLVLYDVCDECNHAMGNELDVVFARGSYEGLLRFRTGLLPPAHFKGIGRRTRYHSRALQGPLKGMYVAPVSSADGSNLVFEPVPQLGFAASEHGEYEYFRCHEIPSREVLRERYGDGGLSVKAMGFLSQDDVRSFLVECGFKPDPGPFRSDFAVVTEGSSPGPIDYRFRVDRVLFRAIAKLAFGYLAAIHLDLARMGTFDAIRSFIRYGTDPGFAVVSLRPFPIRTIGAGPVAEGHILAIRFHEESNELRGYVTLFNRVHYEVCLAPRAFLTAVPWRALSGAHFFDPKARTMREFTPRASQ